MSKNDKMEHTSPVVRTSAGLRDALFDALDGLRNGSQNPTNANAIAKLADQVVQTVMMELAVQKNAALRPKEGQQPIGLPAPVALGQYA